MTYNLFLDDFRYPVDVGNYINPVELRQLYRKEEWVIVRNYPEFVQKIKELGIPSIISFDHDLADGHYHKSFMNQDSIQYEDYREFEDDFNKTGYHCAKWLLEQLSEANLPLPICYIHSMNPIGSDNIRSLLNQYVKYYNDNRQ